MAEHGISIRRATRAVGLSRAAWYRRPERDQSQRDQPVIDALNRLVEQHPRWGFWMCFDRLRLDGHTWNHKRVWRVYCGMKLNLPRRKKRRLPIRAPQSLEVPARPNAIWSLDFMSDALYGGRRFRTLNVLDEGVREALKIVIDTSIPSGRLIRELEQLVSWRGRPAAIRCDNGPEICAQASKSVISSRASPTRMPSSSASTRPTVRRSWMPGCSAAWTRSEPSPSAG